MDVCIKWACFCLSNAHVWTLSCAILIFHPQEDVNKHQHQEIPAMFLHEIYISNKPSTMWWISMFGFFCRGAELLDQIFRFSQNNIQQYPSCMALMKTRTPFPQSTLNHFSALKKLTHNYMTLVKIQITKSPLTN